VIETVGGCDVLLGVIAMARDTESLYAGVKALVCVMKSNPFSRCEMEANKGYQTLAMLLRKKVALLNSHILYLMFTMAGTIDPGGGNLEEGVPNVAAFRDVLCDLDLWHEAPAELERSLFEHFFELLADTSKECCCTRKGHLVVSNCSFSFQQACSATASRSAPCASSP